MSTISSEFTFESAIESSLLTHGAYSKGQSDNYDVELGLFPNELIEFLQSSQAKNWEKIALIHGAEVKKRLLQRLVKEIDLRGNLDVIRNGFTDHGVRFKLVYFKPASGLNPETEKLYNKNDLKIYRQIYYSSKNRNSVDMVLALNGIPLATMELKNQFTNQNVDHAIKQYKTTRDNKELLFAFKKRALVHFAVDQDDVYMTTKIDGKKTRWLPFNKGNHHAKGNPINPDGYRTAYFWEDILQKDSWLEILQRFIHLQIEEIDVKGKIYKKETMIFPRYHQLDSVRKITESVYNNGVGKNYLVQHSAGSGKSNSIAWLAYRLSSLHDAQDKRIFDSVIVVTDRRVLDQQLQNTIYQFEHKRGVVEKINKDSAQLAYALETGSNIIITTLQKFPFILDKVGDIPARKYAVIIDEAHSSQGGEASKKMKEVLSAKSLADAETMDANDDYLPEDFYREQIERSAKSRGPQANISFFAFTATPKYKTLEVFGSKDAEGKPAPFHLYSMRQAIDEGFILDVLENYTSYELFFKLSKSIEDDPKLNKGKASKAIGRFVSLHPHNLAQKTEIIIEHFKHIVSKKIGGRAKAMVVCGSRLHAKRYYEEFNKYIKAKGYQKEIKILVAFSGSVMDDNFPEGVTEPQLTGYGEKELPGVFDKDVYKILIVADKYQTGFDQPLLHTMYVDKKLSGVKAVQTLSRLNRIHAGKEDTFILDFVNDRQVILDSFQPYYEKTTVKEETEVNHLYDLKARLDEFDVCWQSDIDAFAQIYFDPKNAKNRASDQRHLYAFTDPAVERFKAIEEEEKRDEFKKGLRTWVNLYAFLSQIMPFTDTDLEKYYAYVRLLQNRLPKRNISEALYLDDEVALEYYRLQKMKEGAIELVGGEDGEISGQVEAGLKRSKEEEALLSEIITILNDRFATEFEEADKFFFDQVEAEMMEDEKLQTQAKVNKIDTFKFAFDELFIEKLIGRMDQNKEIFEKIIEDEEFGNVVKEFLMKRVYKRMNENE